MELEGLLRRTAAEVRRTVLPDVCVGCDVVGPALCGVCRGALRPDPRLRTVQRLPVTSALVYDGVVRRVVIAVKNQGRTGLAPTLAGPLRAAVAAALDDAERGVLLVPMPGSRRSAVERGYDPVRLLLRRAGLPATPVLRLVRRPEDQLRLDRVGRFANVAGGMAARRPLGGAPVLLVDDVVTTGATLAEAARAVRAAGGRVLGAATAAATPLR